MAEYGAQLALAGPTKKHGAYTQVMHFTDIVTKLAEDRGCMQAWRPPLAMK